MYCQECGAKIPDDSLFCPECGAKQTDIPPTGQNSQTQVVSNDNVEGGIGSSTINEQTIVRQQKVKSVMTPEEEARIKKRNKILGIVIGSLLLLAIVIVGLTYIIKPKIDLNKYITVSFDGYDTVGTAEIYFDYDKFTSEYGDELSKKIFGDELSNHSGTGRMAVESFFENCVNWSLSKTENLSNGDKVKLTWHCNDDMAKSKYGYILKYSDEEYTVADLKEAEMFDPFDGIEVKFEGIAPNGEATVVGDGITSAARDLDFELDKSDGLSNGDKVTVTATYYGENIESYCLNNYGMIPSSLSKEFTVDGLDSYVTKISEVSDDAFTEMKKQAKDVLNADVAQDWDSESETLKSMDYIGCYLLTTKATDSWGNKNVLYLVYKVKVHNTRKEEKKSYDKDNTIYWWISYYDLLVDNNGVTSVNVLEHNETSNRVEIDSGLGDGWYSWTWSYNGYDSLDSLYSDVVIKNGADYNHEEKIDEKSSKGDEKEKDSGLAVKEEGIIFPNSSTEKLKEKDVEKLTDDEVQKAINEIYARNGYRFKDDKKREYYEQYEWYNGTISPDDFTKDMFNKTEKENMELLEKERSKR